MAGPPHAGEPRRHRQRTPNRKRCQSWRLEAEAEADVRGDFVAAVATESPRNKRVEADSVEDRRGGSAGQPAISLLRAVLELPAVDDDRRRSLREPHGAAVTQQILFDCRGG